VIGPDGEPGPDLGFRGLQGRAALEAWPGVRKQLEDLRLKLRAGMATPDQALRFDTATRRLQSARLDHAGEYVERQAHQWYGQVEKDRVENARNDLRDAAMRGDEEGVNRATAVLWRRT
jgi:hypothetical protein